MSAVRKVKFQNTSQIGIFPSGRKPILRLVKSNEVSRETDRFVQHYDWIEVCFDSLIKAKDTYRISAIRAERVFSLLRYYLTKNESITQEYLAHESGCSERVVSRVIHFLKDTKILVSKKSGKLLANGYPDNRDIFSYGPTWKKLVQEHKEKMERKSSKTAENIQTRHDDNTIVETFLSSLQKKRKEGFFNDNKKDFLAEGQNFSVIAEEMKQKAQETAPEVAKKLENCSDRLFETAFKHLKTMENWEKIIQVINADDVTMGRTPIKRGPCKGTYWLLHGWFILQPKNLQNWLIRWHSNEKRKSVKTVVATNHAIQEFEGVEPILYKVCCEVGNGFWKTFQKFNEEFTFLPDTHELHFVCGEHVDEVQKLWGEACEIISNEVGWKIRILA